MTIDSIKYVSKYVYRNNDYATVFLKTATTKSHTINLSAILRLEKNLDTLLALEAIQKSLPLTYFQVKQKDQKSYIVLKNTTTKNSKAF